MNKWAALGPSGSARGVRESRSRIHPSRAQSDARLRDGDLPPPQRRAPCVRCMRVALAAASLRASASLHAAPGVDRARAALPPRLALLESHHAHAVGNNCRESTGRRRSDHEARTLSDRLHETQLLVRRRQTRDRLHARGQLIRQGVREGERPTSTSRLQVAQRAAHQPRRLRILRTFRRSPKTRELRVTWRSFKVGSCVDRSDRARHVLHPTAPAPRRRARCLSGRSGHETARKLGLGALDRCLQSAASNFPPRRPRNPRLTCRANPRKHP